MAAPTVSELLEALGDYADYEELASVTRARSYMTACRRFLALPSSQSDQGSALGYSPQMIQQELEFVRRWIAQNDTRSGGATRFLSAGEGFRR